MLMDGTENRNITLHKMKVNAPKKSKNISVYNLYYIDDY